jgi:hypothetical protein
MHLPAVGTGSIFNCVAGGWLWRICFFKGHFYPAGAAFSGFGTGGNSGWVYLVAFLTVRTGDFHSKGLPASGGFGLQDSEL